MGAFNYTEASLLSHNERNVHRTSSFVRLIPRNTPIKDEPLLLCTMYEKLKSPHIRSGIDPDDNDALLYVIVSLCIVVVVIELAFRIYSTYSWQRQRRYVKCDDAIFFVAAGLAMCQFILVIVQVRYGRGRHSHIQGWEANGRPHTEVMDKARFNSSMLTHHTRS